MKRRWIWVMVLGIIGCLALFMLFTAQREEPAFADKIPILKGLRPFSDEINLNEPSAGFPSPTKSRMRQYYVRASYKEVCRRIDRELPRKPLAVYRDSSETQYEFGSAGRPGEALLWITGYKENKTIVAVLEASEATWADKVNAWWERVTGRKE
jgi:hypothetical protein